MLLRFLFIAIQCLFVTFALPSYTENCSLTFCWPTTCAHPYKPPGACCEQCDKPCEYKNEHYDSNSTFKDDCNICACLKGAVQCTSKICDKCAYVDCDYLSCKETYIPKGECCPECDSSCEYLGEQYSSGETWECECNTCTCADGMVACTERKCETYEDEVVDCTNVDCGYLPCKESYVYPGECCPTCDPMCEYKGLRYESGDMFKDQCNTCTCKEGQVACTKKDCSDEVYAKTATKEQVEIQPADSDDKLVMKVPASYKECLNTYTNDPVAASTAQIICLKELVYDMEPEEPTEPKTDEELVQSFINEKDKTKPPTGHRIRKEYRALSKTEREKFNKAINALYKKGIVAAFARVHSKAGTSAHSGAAFLPWHRAFLAIFEEALRKEDPSVSLPYWASPIDFEMANPVNSLLWTEEYFGNGAGVVNTGPFANWTSGDGRLTREFGKSSQLMSNAGISRILSRCRFKEITSPTAKSENNCEFQHNGVHVWVGGDMGAVGTAAYDPVFYFHHAFVDKIWEDFRKLQVIDRSKMGCKKVDPITDYVDESEMNLPQDSAHKIDANMFAFKGYYNNSHGLAAWWTGGSNPWYSYDSVPNCPDCSKSDSLICDQSDKKCVPISRLEKTLEEMPSEKSNSGNCTTWWCKYREVAYKPSKTPMTAMGWREPMQLPSYIAEDIEAEEKVPQRNRYMSFTGPNSDGRTIRTAFQDEIDYAFYGRRPTADSGNSNNWSSRNSNWNRMGTSSGARWGSSFGQRWGGRSGTWGFRRYRK